MKLFFHFILIFISVLVISCKKDDPVDPVIPADPNETLMDTVQMQIFKFFWNDAEPNSGMIRDRNGASYVTTGGSGFGMMAILVGIERGYITREQGFERIVKMVSFCETADRFHGAWPHWLNGNTGHVIPFSTYDNGGDLVETAFLIQGMLTAQAYFDGNTTEEEDLRNKIQALWEGVEWDWYRQGWQNVLFWHWSPNYGWEINMKITGWNEALIVYVLAAASPTHTIPPEVYHNGWARNGGIVNGNVYEGLELPLGQAYGGPLFFAHYSFLGLNPNGLSDQYADYMLQNTNHSLINYKYCVRNPGTYTGYSDSCWGLTASDDPDGYSAHSPTNDNGTISPTAALSSIVYSPIQSLKAMNYFYGTLKEKVIGNRGPYDAFNQSRNWYANSYLAIDQGPIIIMIENYRTGLLWNNFMKNTDVRQGLDKLGFSY
ncbi:MAG: beta-glucosidase [Marinilabiliales bacterium]|nr:MAG: beta-glucosidase [Marinilabiliales bacterium]